MYAKEDLPVGASCSEVRAEVAAGAQWQRKWLWPPEHSRAMCGVAFESG